MSVQTDSRRDVCASGGVDIERSWPPMPKGVYARRRIPIEERFWPHVDFNGPVPQSHPELGPCWLWTAGCSDTGYGTLWTGDGHVNVHSFAYALLVGPMPKGLQIDHLCRVRRCLHPWHLEAVTPRVNVLRGESVAAIHARKTIAKCGHEFDYNEPGSMSRRCRQCRIKGVRAAQRRYRERHR